MLVNDNPSKDKDEVLLTGRELTVGSFDLALTAPCNIDIVNSRFSTSSERRRKPQVICEEFLNQTTIVLNNKAQKVKEFLLRKRQAITQQMTTRTSRDAPANIIVAVDSYSKQQPVLP